MCFSLPAQSAHAGGPSWSLLVRRRALWPVPVWPRCGSGRAQPRVYLPQMCSMKTEAMKRRLMTSTGTGPTLMPGESSV